MRYFDTGVLLKLYLREPNSADAIAHVQSGGAAPVVLTSLHHLEITAALGQALGRGTLSKVEHTALVASFDSDLATGVYEQREVDWEKTFSRAERLAKAHAEMTLCRSLDTLHVAVALELGVTDFCTFDRRQGELAKAAGVTVVPP